MTYTKHVYALYVQTMEIILCVLLMVFDVITIHFFLSFQLEHLAASKLGTFTSVFGFRQLVAARVSRTNCKHFRTVDGSNPVLFQLN